MMEHHLMHQAFAYPLNVKLSKKVVVINLTTTEKLRLLVIVKLRHHYYLCPMINIIQTFIHYGLHFLFPGVIAFVFFRKEWKKVWLILLATMLVDLDHLLADPVFQEDRCSIGFHYLHSWYAIAFYPLLLFLRKPFFIIGLGLILHMLTDFIDCLFIFNRCGTCYTEWLEMNF